MANSRVSILQRVRQHQPAVEPLPNLQEDWIRYDDVRAKFVEMLEAVGGSAIEVPNITAASTEINKLADHLGAESVCSLVADIEFGNGFPAIVDMGDVQKPHDLANIDLAILPVHFGVAENGAVWLHEPRLTYRVLPFLTQHLALILSAGQIVHNMHEAYERIDFSERTFGVFISGPSKTADIEQSLVIGAHGARSLTIFLTA